MNDDPRFRFHAYCEAQKIPLAGISGEQPSDPNFALQFSDSASPAQIKAANDACYNTPQVFGGWQPLPIPDTASFQKLVVADSTISGSVKLTFPGFLSLVQPLTGYSDRDALKTLWAQLKQESGKSGWLSGKTSDGELVSSRLEKYASQSNFTLV